MQGRLVVLIPGGYRCGDAHAQRPCERNVAAGRGLGLAQPRAARWKYDAQVANETKPSKSREALFRRSLVALANLVVAAVIPLWASFQKPPIFTEAELYLLGVLLLIVLTTVEIGLLAESAFAKEKRQTEIWDARQALDARLQEVRRLFHQIGEDRLPESDLFVLYFDQRLQALEARLRDAVSKREIQIDETMLDVTTWLMESSFRGRQNDIFRAVHFTADTSFFFDVHSRRYFHQAYALITDNKLAEVRRLIVYDTPDDLKTGRIQHLVEFHNRTPKYSCRVLPKAAFQRIVNDYKLHQLARDFGIYGDSYLYKGVINHVDEIVGYYSRDENEIARFKRCFDDCWNEATDTSYPSVVVPAGNLLPWLFVDNDPDPTP
jgi:hypothetical protein